MFDRYPYPWAKVAESKFNKEPYGIEFATKFANSLEKQHNLVLNMHRDFCGVGFEFSDKKFYFGHVYDGCCFRDIKTFYKKHDFVQWLSEKNDYKMSGLDDKDDLFEIEEFMRNNQRIYKEDLRNFIDKGEKIE